jgi:hypothetical protein
MSLTGVGFSNEYLIAVLVATLKWTTNMAMHSMTSEIFWREVATIFAALFVALPNAI